MQDTTHTIALFKSFAEEQLHDHFYEIDTCYYKRQLNTWGSEEEAYEKHRELYSKELEEKIHSLTIKEDKELEQQLQELKRSYVEQLCLENFNKTT